MICNNYEPADKSRAEIQMMSCMVQWYSVNWGKCQLVEISYRYWRKHFES